MTGVPLGTSVAVERWLPNAVRELFSEIYPPNADGQVRALPRDDWKPYMAAVLREPLMLAPTDRWGTERKTGLEPATSSLARTRSTN